jgi:hypothetical protein
MASKSKRARLVKQRNLSKDFMYWAVAVFVIKLIIISNVQGGAWLGADGESYLKGADSLIQKGFFSEDTVLNYWPAGYPLFIFLFSIIGKSFVLTTLTVIQSAIYSFATYFFAAQLVKTRLNKFAYLVFFIILFNPTLSLSSLAIGYESIAASGYLVAAAIIIKDLIEKDDKKLIQNVLITSGIFGLMSFIQPRLIVSGILINLLWILIRRPWKSASVFIATSLAVTLFFPATLIYRNNKAVGLNTISTNLGVTMNIGAGDKSTGGYTNSATGVDCNSSSSDVVKADREQVACILKWYLVNPKPTLKLFYNKSIFFWSPWYGPEANGTMARNPWLKINPIKNISESSPDGQKLIYGGLGKLISWIWLVGGIVLFTYGFLILWRLKSIERIIGLIAGIAVMSSWLITLISIGDHRFRLPIMGMSLFLQAVGIRTLFKGGKPPMVDGPALR